MQVAASVALILVAFSVTTTASTETEPSLSQKFEQFQQDVQTLVDRFGEKANAALDDLQRSEFHNKARNWVSETFQRLKATWKEALSNQESD